ncbi:MAG: hypothetical protein M1817_002781 [Caeruleum heppii]|nr:MAG: hypothetical protein M1817_002781 [Caeruleum heppii]
MSATPPLLTRTIYLGTFIHSRSLQELDICRSGAIGVDEQGKIAFVDRDITDRQSVAKSHGWPDDTRIVTTGANQFFFPGFIDTHTHACQYPNTGIFGSSTLLAWLETYTFPLEASFSSLSRARTVYPRVVARTLAHGTTTAAYYATIHVDASNLLADICLEKGQRGLVGRCCMDRMSPEYYRDESAEEAVRKTEETIRHCREIDPEGHLVVPVITPRFAPSCTPTLLSSLGNLHKQTSLPVQTHIAETLAECNLVHDLFPDSSHYTSVYDTHGLLTSRTILAHAIHLSAAERRLIKARHAGISHCPLSNTSLTSGRALIRTMLDEGLKVGLGTDMSGGSSPSILDAARQAAMVSRHVAMEVREPGRECRGNEEATLSVEEVLYLATRGGADVVGLGEKVGGFEVGWEWDAQLVGLGRVVGSSPVEGGDEGGNTDREGEVHADDADDDDADDGPVDIFGWESWAERVAKWVYCGDDRNTKVVWVRGREVHRRRG